MSVEPPPSVSVVGVGSSGRDLVDRIDTTTAATIHTVSTSDEAVAVADAVADQDFCFLAGDLRESSVPDWASTVLSHESHTICLVTGSTDRPDDLLENTNLLVPIDDAAVTDSAWLVSTAIADLVECMLLPTRDFLGPADIALSVGSRRLGSLSVDVDGGQQTMLTRGVRIDKPASVLLFKCVGDRTTGDELFTLSQRAAERHDPDDSLLFDQRIHPRYQHTPHTKRLLFADADHAERARVISATEP